MRLEFLLSKTEDAKDLPLPTRQTPQSAGLDLYAKIDAIIKKGERTLIPTGIRVALPFGYEAQVRPRSGLALKYGVTVLNTPGTIDADFRGEVGVILVNLGKEDFAVKRGDRIAQMVIAKVEMVEFAEVCELPETERGEGGYGSTG
ncbi:MAG: dUTP diphosphatase [Firmicutes bacterium]|nr:dUTP diphosphatase [Bacillota bacterium]